MNGSAGERVDFNSITSPMPSTMTSPLPVTGIAGNISFGGPSLDGHQQNQPLSLPPPTPVSPAFSSQTPPTGQNPLNNPFQCSNSELIKRMIERDSVGFNSKITSMTSNYDDDVIIKWNEKLTDKSWIPEEDVRKQAQKAMKGTEQMNSFQIICKINEQILVTLVEWAKGKRFKIRSFDLSWPHFDLYFLPFR